MVRGKFKVIKQFRMGNVGDLTRARNFVKKSKRKNLRVKIPPSGVGYDVVMNLNNKNKRM